MTDPTHDDPAERTVVEAVPSGLRLGGEIRPTDATFTTVDPSTGRTLAEVADATPADAVAALDRAVDAQRGWAATAPRERAEVLRRAWELMVERRDELALLCTLEMGKPVDDSRGEVSYAAEFFRWFAEEAVRIDGGHLRDPAGTSRLLVMRQPVGPTLCITPWNFPLAMGTRKLGPALAAGCTAIVKPASQTPLCMLAVADILAEAGLPAGVLSVLPTSDAGSVVEPLLADRRLRKLSFTGSTEVGRILLEQAAPNVLRVSLELGGNAPLLVFDDADLDGAVEGALTAKMRNMGEACTSANRIYVQAGVADEFVSRLTARMGSMVVGRGTEPGVQVGPLIDEAGRDKVIGLVDDAVTAGAEIRTGGRALGGPGWFFEPTVLTGVSPDMRIQREEIFGPVAAIVTFDTDEEAVELANDTEYGLASYVFTRDLDRALTVAESLEVGMVGLNQGMVSNAAAPFGGVKHSGLGREGGFVGIDEFLETKVVAIADRR